MKESTRIPNQNQYVFINQDSGYLMVDIINQYVKHNVNCILLTGRLIERSVKLDKSVSIKRIARYRRNNYFARIVTWFLAFIKIWVLVRFKYKNSHLFIVTNPPIAPLIPLFCKNSYTLLFFDVYIEKPKDIMILSKISIVVNLWIKAHTAVMKKAKHIFALTDGMRSSIEKYSGERTVDVIPIWSDNKLMKPISASENSFVKRYNLNGKFVIMYSGNIGISSGVETLIEVARNVTDRNIDFIIIGEGIKKSALVRRVKELRINNCTFLPWQNFKVLPYSFAAANLAVISLSETGSNRSIPSKLFDFMSVGAPILSICNLNSDLATFVNEYKVGESFSHMDKRGIINFIYDISRDKELSQTFSNNSIKASKYFTPNNALLYPMKDLEN